MGAFVVTHLWKLHSFSLCSFDSSVGIPLSLLIFSFVSCSFAHSSSSSLYFFPASTMSLTHLDINCCSLICVDSCIRKVHNPYFKMLYIAAFQNCNLAFSFISGSRKTLFFIVFQAFFAFVSLSCAAFVVVSFRLICWPSRFAVLVNCIFLYFSGSIFFISLISVLCFLTRMTTLSQFMGSLYLSVISSKVLSFG